MEAYKIQLIESIISIIFFMVALKIFHSITQKVGTKFSYHKNRIKILKSVISFVTYILLIGVLVFIWGIAPSKLAGYIASLFTVVGIAFLAQWSIISNITATLIIFFNHQVKIGDTIAILDKDSQIEGKILGAS